MGGLFNKKETVIGPHTKVGMDSFCPFCGKYFSKNTTYHELNSHKDDCYLEQRKPRAKKDLHVEDPENVLALGEVKHSHKKLNLNQMGKINLSNKIPYSQNHNNVNFDNTGHQISHRHSKIHGGSKINQKNNYNNNNNNINTKIKPILKKKSASNANFKFQHDSDYQSQQQKEFENFFFEQFMDKSNEKIEHFGPVKKHSIIQDISNYSLDYIKDFPFEEKVLRFKQHLQGLKVDWREGFCNLELDRDNFLLQSIQQFDKIDPYKELHINFKGEISYDAGGIIREWFTIIFKELHKENLKLFELSESTDFNYKIHKNAETSIENLDIFHFIGKILAKALLDNLTVNTSFNKLIYKMILEEEISLDDLVFIDKTLSRSMKELLKMDRVEDLELYFLVQYEQFGKMVHDELIPNGSNILVTQDNLDEYIIKRIEHIQQRDKIFINEIKSGLFSLIPPNLIKIFNCDEFELLLNGQPFIDLYDWQQNTTYKNYNENSLIIKNFWDILSSFTQENLAKFLQFCTGSTRVPLGGFSSLESNRGNISKFCIVKIEYTKKSKNFIRAHTCFNRLDLPEFPSKKDLEQAINFIIQNEILGFGVD